MEDGLEKLSLGQIVGEIIQLEMHKKELSKIVGEDELHNPLPMGQKKYLKELYAELDRREEVYTTIPQRKVYP